MIVFDHSLHVINCSDNIMESLHPFLETDYLEHYAHLCGNFFSNTLDTYH